MEQNLVVTDRDQLQSLLNDTRTSLMLILAEEGSQDEEFYYQVQRHIKEPWRRVALIQNDTILTPLEKKKWDLKGGGCYVVLGMAADGERRPVHKGKIATLSRGSGTSLLKLRQAFSRADRYTKS